MSKYQCGFGRLSMQEMNEGGGKSREGGAMVCCDLSVHPAQPIDETDCDFAKNEVVWGGGWVKD
jgi:hypothetical protein